MFKVKNKNTRTTSMALLSLTLNIFHTFFSVSLNFEQVNVSWVTFSLDRHRSDILGRFMIFDRLIYRSGFFRSTFF